MRSTARALGRSLRAATATRLSTTQPTLALPAGNASARHVSLRSIWAGACPHHATPLDTRPSQLSSHRLDRSLSTNQTATVPTQLPPTVQQLQTRISSLLFNLQHSELPTALPSTTTALLSEAQQALTQPFLLVIVGEYNSSKSSLINALVGEALLDVGPLPTTEHIYVIQSHDAPCTTPATDSSFTATTPPAASSVRTITSKSPLLRSVSIVDTPGTNALTRQHEQLTTAYLPRADLLILLTSADRPFSHSERAFLTATQQYQKAVVLVVGKADLLSSEAEKAQVVEYVRAGAAEVLRTPPTVLVASTRPGSIGVAAVTSYITRQLTATRRLHLKLASPLLVARQVLSERHDEVQLLDALLVRRAAVLEQVERLSAEYVAGMGVEFERQWTKVHVVFARLQQRSVQWVEDKGQLLRVAEWLRDNMSAKYEREVQQWTDVQAEVKAALMALLDGLSERGERYVREVRRVVAEGEEDMAAERQHRLLQSMHGAVTDILTAELAATTSTTATAAPLSSAAISASLSSTLYTSAALQTGGLSLALGSLLTLSMLDFTGVLSSLLVVGGAGWLPLRRRRLVGEVKGRVAEMEARVRGVVGREVEGERERVERRVGRWMEEVRRAVEVERGRLTAARAEVGEMRAECEQLLRDVNAWTESAAAVPASKATV